MIIVRIWGGLGNQMFQYAAARRLAHKHNTVLKLDINDLVLAHGYAIYGLRFFNIQENIAGLLDVRPYYLYGSLRRIATRMLGKRLCYLLLNRFIKDKKHYLKQRYYNYNPASKEESPLVGKILSQRFFHFDPEVLEAPDDVYLMGSWISENYFKDIEDIIRNEFTVKTPQTGKNREIAEMILNTESVALHVRGVREHRYASDTKYRATYKVYGLDYYEQCIQYIVDRVKSPYFFVFSDDIAWARKNLKISHPTTFVDNNDASTDYEDMKLMSQCKHNIIANSTFSWWGAWLNTNPEKIVCTPEKFVRLWNFDNKDVLPDEWIKL